MYVVCMFVCMYVCLYVSVYVYFIIIIIRDRIYVYTVVRHLYSGLNFDLCPDAECSLFVREVHKRTPIGTSDLGAQYFSVRNIFSCGSK